LQTENCFFPIFVAVKKALAIVLGVLFIDQSVKLWIKTHMYLGQAHQVTGDWFYLHFVENPGMAFGLQLGEGAWGKLLLSVFRLLAVAGIGWYMWTLFRKNVRPLLIVCVALIFAGALGNILDSVFYGKIFDASDPYEQNVAQLFPEGGGYAGFLHGQVVDMFYFPVFSGHFPDSFPIWGGEDFVFFRPVFNIADASISVGVFLLIIFQRRLFGATFQPSRRRIIATNAFFGFIIFVFAAFLLLTYLTLFSETHPLSKVQMVIVFALSAAAGYGMFWFLNRQPPFMPELVPAEPLLQENPENPQQTTPASEPTKTADTQDSH
jgi:signal peptidase II